jgi:small ligand-binding sensory domain FIST
MPFRCGHAASARWEEAVEQVLSQLGAQPPSRGPGFVYVTEELGGHAVEIVRRLRDATGVQDWVGSVGLGVMAPGTEYMLEPALSVMLAEWSRADYRVFSGRSRAPGSTERTAAGATAAHLAIVHGDPETPDMPELVEDMAAKVASGFLIGGLSSARSGTFQIANDVVCGGLSGLVLSSAVSVTTRVTQGCMPLPGRYTITAAERNIVLSIDDQPALDVYRSVVGGALARDWNRAARTVLVGFPVPSSDTGDYVVRNVVGLDMRAKAIAVGAPVEAGTQILFCRRDGAAARQDMERMLDRLADEMTGEPQGALYVSCIGRGEHMFGTRSAEVGLIRERFGELPLTGFFASGEISHNRLYGYSGVLTLFS